MFFHSGIITNLHCRLSQKNPNMKIKSKISMSVKALIIGVIALFLLIPVSFVRSTTKDRHTYESEAIEQISKSWAGEQTVMGPLLRIDSLDVITSAEQLDINCDMLTETRSYGRYDVIVYRGKIEISGNMIIRSEWKPKKFKEDNLQCQLLYYISDPRGIESKFDMTFGNKKYECDKVGFGNKTMIGTTINLDTETAFDTPIPFKIEIPIKGSKSINFIPVGGTVNVNVAGNHNAPSFFGMQLPNERMVDDTGFTAQWSVPYLASNIVRATVCEPTRWTGLLYTYNSSDRYDWEEPSSDSRFGVRMINETSEYKVVDRTTKYAILVILLTFAGILFAEIKSKEKMSVFQYILVGLALVLFYLLLLSFAENIGYTAAYIIASIMIIAMISLYVLAILRNKRLSGLIAMLLTFIYTALYIILHLGETALLVGSLLMFAVLGVMMYMTKDMGRTTEVEKTDE